MAPLNIFKPLAHHNDVGGVTIPRGAMGLDVFILRQVFDLGLSHEHFNVHLRILESWVPWMTRLWGWFRLAWWGFALLLARRWDADIASKFLSPVWMQACSDPTSGDGPKVWDPRTTSRSDYDSVPFAHAPLVIFKKMNFISAPLGVFLPILRYGYSLRHRNLQINILFDNMLHEAALRRDNIVYQALIDISCISCTFILLPGFYLRLLVICKRQKVVS